MKTVITVSRKWNNPAITTVVEDSGISLSMNLEDFKTALKQEIGSVTWTFRKDTIDAKIDSAIDTIIEGIKQESSKAM